MDKFVSFYHTLPFTVFHSLFSLSGSPASARPGALVFNTIKPHQPPPSVKKKPLSQTNQKLNKQFSTVVAPHKPFGS